VLELSEEVEVVEFSQLATVSKPNVIRLMLSRFIC